MKTPKQFRTLAFSIPLLLAIYPSALAQPPSATGTLSVKVLGLKTTEGKIIVNVYRKEDELFGQPHRQREAVLTATTATLAFPDLPFAHYVVFAFHDENNNGTLDHNWLHLPKEPMGYSNNWHFGLFTGMPSFEKSKFDFTQENSVVTITVK